MTAATGVFAQAAALQGAGRVEEAIALYRRHLEAEPLHAEGWYRLGIALHGRREFAAAAQALAEAARLAPNKPVVWAALGVAQCDAEALADALASFDRARAIDPAYPQVNAQLGAVLQALGRLPEAIERFAEEEARFPEQARNANNLGTALQAAGRVEEAERAFTRAVRADRDCRPAHANLAALFHRRGDLAEAEAAFREVLRLDPDDAQAHSRLGHILVTLWRAEEAEVELQRAMALDPADPLPPRTLAYVLHRLNRPDEARALAQRTLAERPDDLQSAVIANLTLPLVYPSLDAMHEARAGFVAGMDRLEFSLDAFAQNAEQVFSLAWTNFHLAYQGSDDRVLQTRYADFVGALLERAAPAYRQPRARRRLAPGERLRVGFISAYFRDCTAGKYFRSWLTGIDRARFEVFAYSTAHVHDAFAADLASAVDHYRRVMDAPARVADVVLADQLDVLVHPAIGMDASSYVLSGLRLAPVQCAGWGHPVTSGQALIDYYLTCGEMEPDGADAHYRERLVRLPGLGTDYPRPATDSKRSRAGLGLPEGRLYLCPQSLFKVHPDNDALFAAVLRADPQGVLVFFRDVDAPLTVAFRARLAQAGIPAERCVFLDRVSHADYLRLNALCDVMLDTLHWSGGNTSLDALAVGLPVVTLPGAYMRGRQSLAMLRRLDLDELVARDADDYVRIATAVAGDPARRATLSQHIDLHAHKLFGDREPVRAFEDFLASTHAQ